ncbi:MAG TPA: F0F1 ATP synthase subunit delta [Armatimonadota bacterium]|jgi:F-type H+-transporting ATPase subunit delta
MRMTALARRYAGALFEVARNAKAIDKIESDLGLISYSLQTMPRLAEALAHPILPADRKKQIVSEVFKSEINSITLDFICLLVDKRRANLLDEIEGEYINLANDYRGVTPALVTSAVALTSDEKSALQEKLEDFTGKRVDITLEEDPELVGGIIVRIGDTIIDGSVRGYLASLKTRLLGQQK